MKFFTVTFLLLAIVLAASAHVLLGTKGGALPSKGGFQAPVKGLSNVVFIY